MRREGCDGGGAIVANARVIRKGREMVECGGDMYGELI